MRLSKRTIASRANGRLSRGPITEEGKRKVSLNGLRHGLLSKITILPGESQPRFEELLNQFIEKFAPADGVEFTYVEELAATTWRLRRLWAVENRIWDDAMDNHDAEDQIGCITNGFLDLTHQPALALLQRYQARLSNTHQRALNNLMMLRDLDCQANLESDNPPEIKPVEPPSPTPAAPEQEVPEVRQDIVFCGLSERACEAERENPNATPSEDDDRLYPDPCLTS